jgi:hypothetical protein
MKFYDLEIRTAFLYLNVSINKIEEKHQIFTH